MSDYNKVSQEIEVVESPKMEGNAKVQDEELNFSFQWVKVSTLRLCLFYVLILLSGGILFLLHVNLPLLKLRMTTVVCSAEEATMAHVHLKEDEEYCAVERHNIDKQVILCFESMATRYYATSANAFQLTIVPFEPESFSELFVQKAGSPPSREWLKVLYGPNSLNLPVADALTILILEMLSPFYLFQYFAIAIWLATDYIAYSVIILVITAISIYFVVSDKLFNVRRLHELAENCGVVEVPSAVEGEPVTQSADSQKFEMSDRSLVPGDLFFLAPDMTFPCDCILIRGKVVVDESMLTGESVPVTKTEYAWSVSNPDATKRKANLLFCGTKVKAIGADDRPMAMAFRTGFRSSKGSIIGTLARPPREIVSFMPDALRAILLMIFIMTVIFAWSASELKRLDTADADVGIAYLTALTIAVPPGLVACLSIATSISVFRLSKQLISISDTMKLNAAGYVTYACFDKTGTLTDENIVYKGFHATTMENVKSPESIATLVMATCHSLSLLNAQPAGDQLELELLRASGWTLTEDAATKLLQAQSPVAEKSIKCTITRNFEYSPEKLRAGVVISGDDQEPLYLLKGSPEVLAQMCDPASIPASFNDDMDSFTRKGFRVLAFAYRELSQEPSDWVKTASQLDLESSKLVYLGLVYFQNKLKPDTWPRTISSLQTANIKVNMITGDHVHTAVAISSECNVLPAEDKRLLYVVDATDAGEIVISTEKAVANVTLIHAIEESEKVPADGSPVTRLAVTGAALRNLQSTLSADVFDRLVRTTSVFARVKPDQKRLVVQELKKPQNNSQTPTYVLFCGDGANDMEALSVATVGVSLCDTATTVAASIVSLTQSPFSTVQVLKEGRCSLVTAYVLVVFNILYAMIQLFMTCFVNNLGLVFGDSMYIVQDLFFSFFLGLSISRTLPDPTLAPNLPPARLFTPGLMFRLFTQLAIFPAFQAILLAMLKAEDWYVKFDPAGEPLTLAWAPECSTLQILALAQLMIASVVATIGKPFRLAWYENRIHLAVMSLQFGYILFLLFDRDHDAATVLANCPFPRKFGGKILGLIVANAAASALFSWIADKLFPY